MVKFSLVIPVYNKQDFVRNTLDSVVANHDLDDSEFECILVNEASTDDSGSICEEYEKKYQYFKYYRIPNDGVMRPSNARNFGKKMVSGQYVMFLDADDELMPDFIIPVTEFLDNNPEYDFYLCNRYVSGNLIIHLPYQFNLFGPTLSCCIFKKEITDKFDFENIYCEDIVYTEEALLNGAKYYYDQENPTSYAYNEDSCCISKLENCKYTDWAAPIVERFQNNPNYKYYLDENGNIFEKN